MHLTEYELSLMEIFREKAAELRREKLQVVEIDQLRAEETQHREREKRDTEEAKELETMLLATVEQIDVFRSELDDYDTATVHALIDNQRALDEVVERRETMEARAYRLPDGRAVFKTDNGEKVFDRHGAELPRDVIHPESIPDALPRWEAYQTNVDAERKLLHERADLHTFQQKADEARAAIDKGKISTDALAKMNADLKSSVPDAVEARLQGADAERILQSRPALPNVGSLPTNPRAQSAFDLRAP